MDVDHFRISDLPDNGAGASGGRGTNGPGRNLSVLMRHELDQRGRGVPGFARAALVRAETILARMEAGGDPQTVDKWRRVVSSLELEAAREVVAEMRGAA